MTRPSTETAKDLAQREMADLMAGLAIASRGHPNAYRAILAEIRRREAASKKSPA